MSKVDAMASTRMLTQLLRDDNIAYAVRPVSNFSQIIENKDTYITSDIKVIFMINCGAVYNISKTLNLAQSERRCFILDNHRPFHLANVHSRENVVVFDDKTPDAIDLDTARSSMFTEESMNATNTDSLASHSQGGPIEFDFPASDDESDYSDRSSENNSDSSSDDEMEFDDDELSDDEDLENVEDGEEEAEFSEEEEEGKDDGNDDIDDNKDDQSANAALSSEDVILDEDIAQSEIDTVAADLVDDAIIADLSDNGSNSNSAGVPANADYISSDNSNDTSGEGSNMTRTDKGATEEEAEDEEDAEDDIQPRGVKRKGLEQKYDPKKQKKDAYKKSIRRYYGKYYDYAPPTAVMVYNLVNSRAGIATPLEHIWQAVLGVMDQYHKYRLSEENFQGCREWLREILGDVSGINSSSPNSRYTVGEGDQEVVIPGAETGHIVHSRDYKLFLYRHQSLFDAMFHSPVVASSLHIWSQSQGEGKLREVLATFGMPLQQCKQLFNFMNPSLRRHFHGEVTKDRSSVLEPQLDENGNEIRNKPKDELENERLIANFCKELIGYSFFRYNSFRNPVSSSDVVLAASALLEMCKSEDFTPPGVADSAAGNDENVNNQNNPSSQSAVGGTLKKEGGGGHSMMVAFNEAYDCLSMRSDDLLKKGISNAIVIQKAIVRRATMLLEEGSDALHSMHRFYYTNINNISESGHGTSGGTVTSIATSNNRSHHRGGSTLDVESGSQDIDSIFTRPLVLARLGHFVMDVKRSLKKKEGGWVGNKLFPFFLLSKRKDRMLIVGVSPLHSKLGEKEGPDGVSNMSEAKIEYLRTLASFKHFYKLAAEDLNIDYKCDGFDSNIIEIAVEDAYDFIGNLDRLYRESVRTLIN